MLVPILFVISGLMGAALSGLIGSHYLVLGPGNLWALGLGFIAGFLAPLWWSLLGVGFGNLNHIVSCQELERWSHTIFIAAVLGILAGLFVFAMENPLVPPFSPMAMSYLLTFIVVAEVVSILGRGFNWLLGRIA